MPSFAEKVLDQAEVDPAFSFRANQTAPLPSEITFQRGTTGYVFNQRTGLYVSRDADVPRYMDTPRTGASQGLLVEPGSQNHVTWSSKINSNKWFVPTNSVAEEQVDNVIDGEEAFAWSENIRDTNAGVFTSEKEVTQVFAEERSADQFRVLVFGDQADNAASVVIDWTNEEVSTSSRIIDAHFRVLSRNSPNEDKRLAQIIIRYDPTDAQNGSVSGESRRIELRPNRSGTGQTIFHHAQIEDSPTPSLPIVTQGSAVTRGRDNANVDVSGFWSEQEFTILLTYHPLFFTDNNLRVLGSRANEMLLQQAEQERFNAKIGGEWQSQVYTNRRPFSIHKVAVGLREDGIFRIAVDGNTSQSTTSDPSYFLGGDYTTLQIGQLGPSFAISTLSYRPKLLPLNEADRSAGDPPSFETLTA